LQVPESLKSSAVPRSHKNPNRGRGSKFCLGAVKLCRAGHGLLPPLDILSSIYRGFALSGGIDSATFGSLWERGTAELFNLSGTCKIQPWLNPAGTRKIK